jgi:predicted small metal-binding protein
MSKEFGCGDVVAGCRFTITAANEEEILKQVAQHAAAAHGIREVTPELVARVKAAIRDVPRK